MNKVGRITPKEFRTSYWCPDCGKLVHATCTHSIPYELEYDDEIEFISASVDLTILCSKCDSCMLPIDYLISRQIKALNDMGFKTMYCCAGHLNCVPNLNTKEREVYKYNIESSYISFTNIPENEYCKFVVKRLLSLQEFGFITLEEDMEEIWTIRAQEDLIKTFSDVRNGFINFVNSLIINLDRDGTKSHIKLEETSD